MSTTGAKYTCRIRIGSFFTGQLFLPVWDLPRGQPEGNQHGKAIFTGAPGTSQKMPVVRQSHHKCRFVI